MNQKEYNSALRNQKRIRIVLPESSERSGLHFHRIFSFISSITAGIHSSLVNPGIGLPSEISSISTSPKRDDTILLESPFKLGDTPVTTIGEGVLAYRDQEWVKIFNNAVDLIQMEKILDIYGRNYEGGVEGFTSTLPASSKPLVHAGNGSCDVYGSSSASSRMTLRLACNAHSKRRSERRIL